MANRGGPCENAGVPRLTLSIVLGVAVWTMTAGAHHSLSSAYDTSRQVSVDGRVAEFQFVNPHPYIIVNVTGGDGRVRSWHLELDNRWELADIGVTSSTFKPGDRVVAAGSPGRADAPILYVRTLDRPADGLRYEQVGTRPRLGRK